jgi:ATP-dependent Clp protease ATP-binding subunit ClpC
VGRTFRPEFVNRLDKIIVFRPLSRALMRTILRKELNKVLDRRGLRRRDWAVEWEASAIEFLLDRGFSPEMGARPLKRAIDQHLLAPLAATLVEHRFPEGDQFLFVRSDGKSIEVEFVDPDADTSAAELQPEMANSSQVSLPAMILRPEGTTVERVRAAAVWANIQAQLSSPAWADLESTSGRGRGAGHLVARGSSRDLRAACTHGSHRRSGANRRASQTAARHERGETARASRELIARLALQLHLVQQGQADAMEDMPIDVLLTVEPSSTPPPMSRPMPPGVGGSCRCTGNGPHDVACSSTSVFRRRERTNGLK